MVTKGNSTRKKDLKEDSKPKEVAEPKPEINLAEIIQTLREQIVSELKPDMEKRLTAIDEQIKANSQDLAKQISEEIKDIRSNLPQPQIPQPDMQQKADVLSQPEIPEGQPQPLASDRQSMLLEVGLRLVEKILMPKAPQTNAQMFQTFEQATIRKNMADISMDDYINQAVKKQVVKQILGNGFNEDEYQKAKMTGDHYMKPLRDVGINAEKAKQAEQLKHMQQTEEKQ